MKETCLSPSARIKLAEHIACTLVLVFIGTGCGADPLVLSGDHIEILVGKDSAGAVIEIEKRGSELVRARVADVVLGTGEAEILPVGINEVSFMIEFPAGVTISYVGAPVEITNDAFGDITGTWIQHPDGIFGADTGTWRVHVSPE